MGTGWLQAEDFIDFVHDGLAFGIGKFAVGVEHLLDLSTGLESSFAMLAKRERLMGGAG